MLRPAVVSAMMDQLKRLLPQCLLPDQVRIGSRVARAMEQVRRGGNPEVPLERWLEEARASVVRPGRVD